MLLHKPTPIYHLINWSLPQGQGSAGLVSSQWPAYPAAPPLHPLFITLGGATAVVMLPHQLELSRSPCSPTKPPFADISTHTSTDV